MYARFFRQNRSLLLAAGLGFILALNACSTEESTSTATADSTAEAPTEETAKAPAVDAGTSKATTERQIPAAGATRGGAALTERMEAERKEAERKDAERKEDPKRINAKGEKEGKGGQLSREEYKQRMMVLSEEMRGGKIDKREYGQKKDELERLMRTGSAEPKPVDPDGGKLVFATLEHDFGTVWDTEDLKWEFAFQNKGQKTLNITRVKPSCGCTSASLSKRQFEPGEGELIPLTWKPKGAGPQKKTITISHDNGPDQVLNISANVKAFVELQPKLIRLGDLPQHEDHHSELKMIVADKNFQITNIIPKSPYLKASEKGRDEYGNILIDVVIGDNAPWGNFNARLEIEGTGVTEPGGEPVTHKVNLQVIAKLYGDIRMEPEQIQLGVIKKDSPFVGTALLYHVDGVEFDLPELSMRFRRPENMTVRQEKTTKNGKPAVKIIVEGDTTGFADAYVRGTIFFKTSLGDADNQQLQISGSIR